MSFIQELLTEHLFQEPRVLGAADKSPGLAGPGVHTFSFNPEVTFGIGLHNIYNVK